MNLTLPQTLTLILAWSLYGAIHSLLASLAVKQHVAAHWPQWQRGYRLAFNVIAAVLLVPPLALTWAWQGPPLWAWTGMLGWLADTIALAALATFVWSTRYYDMDSFLGTAQWRGEGDAVRERLSISPLHRFVRHPWYCLALLILWTRDMDSARLVSTACITAYFWLGSRLEERKLIALHGEAYRRYRKRVAGLLPLPGCILGRDEAKALVDLSAQKR